MGDVIAFPAPARPEPQYPGLTEEETARYLAMIEDGYSSQEAIEVLALARRIKGASHADNPAAG